MRHNQPRSVTIWGSALSLLMLIRALAQAQSDWTPQDFVHVERISDVELSPTDPDAVVWVKSAPEKDKDKMISHIYRSVPGGGVLQLTRGKTSCTSPHFSPDGRVIAFISARELPKGKDREGEEDAKEQIWILDGGEPYPVTEFARAVQRFAWRDTNHLVFAAQEPPPERELRLKEKKDKSQVVEEEETESPVRLFEVETTSRKVTRLTSNTDRISAFFLSPDRRQVVTFHEQSLRFNYDNQVRPWYFLTDLRTGERKRIFADHRYFLGGVVWKPDSSGFYALNHFTTDPKYLQAFVTELWEYALADGKEVAVPLDWPNGLATPDEPDGCFVALPDGFVALLEDGVRTRAARYVRDPGWRKELVPAPLGLNIAALYAAAPPATQRMACVVTSADHPPQLVKATLDRAEFKAAASVVDLNANWKDKPKAHAEVVRWAGARDEQIEGILFHPHAEPGGERRPLVLMIHGGPFGASHDAWSDSWGSPIQAHCQRGAFVLLANYHGSSGYGLDFAQSIAGGRQYYELPVEDLERGVQSLVDRGLVDPERIGVMGWSNGAILTLALIVHNPARYKAAASGAGGFEWVADTSITSFGQAFNDYYFGKMPYEDPERYRSVAPYYQADRIKTPLIIFHGDADTSVPVHHGWMQFRALQQRTQTPVRFILFPGEEHGLKKLSSQERKVEEELSWFDKYLYHKTEPKPLWIKEGSPIETLVKRDQARRVGGRFGEKLEGKLVPEVVRFAGMNVGRFEVTQAQFAAFAPDRPASAGRENFPAAVSFAEAKAYCAWLSRETRGTWRLPTAAEADKLYKQGDAVENTLDWWAGYAPNAEDVERLLRSVAGLGPGALLREVGSFAGRGDDPVYDLGGNAAEWVVMSGGEGKLFGGSADLPKVSLSPQATPDPAYAGFRVVKD